MSDIDEQLVLGLAVIGQAAVAFGCIIVGAAQEPFSTGFWAWISGGLGFSLAALTAMVVGTLWRDRRVARRRATSDPSLFQP